VFSSQWSVVSARARCLSLALFLCIFSVTRICFADFKFAVIGDTRANDEDGINTDVLGNLMEAIKSEKVNFIVFVGDIITGTVHSDEHTRRLKKWKKFTAGYGMPVYPAIGNHEIESEMSEDIFKSVFALPRNGPQDLKEIVYSFNYRNSHFVVIDTNRYNNFHELGTEQMEWIERDLKNNSKRTIFVFGHEPAYPKKHVNDSLDRFPAIRDELWALFKMYDVMAYFCGHDHLYDRSLYEGVHQVITGGGGAPLHGRSENGGFYHFIMVEVRDNGSCSVVVKDADSTIRDSFVIRK
jgi:3',5'-cyclic AMP phosphodiesterase CpdA